MTDSARKARTVAEQFALNLIRCRERSGLNQEEVARKAGLGRAHVSILEHAGRIPQIDTLIKLAGALDIEPGELLRGMTWHPSERREGGFRDGEEPAPD